MNMLLIDDDPFALRLLARQLDRLGHYQVTQCDRAPQALALLEEHPAAFDLLFCDLQMPDIDGVEFMRHLARIEFGGSVVLVSGEDGRIMQTVQRLALAHDIRMLGALSKPVSTDALRGLLEKAVTAIGKIPRTAAPIVAPDDLARGIAAGELVNHYQPKVDLESGELLGVEALVRWQHPQAGLVFPDRFIPTAEEHGLIDDLTRAVLVSALQQARQWQDGGLALQVAVNISMDNLAALDFPDVVVQLADEAGVALSGLVLEVTESRLMKDPRTPLDVLTRLRLKRAGLSIDDFGTGHSSLAQLRDLPFDELKLDRGFVNGAHNDTSKRAIVEATLSMARQLGIKSVAEGIEDRADWDFLRKLGCDVAQGYFIARPMPGAQVPVWRAGWEKRRLELGTSRLP